MPDAAPLSVHQPEGTPKGGVVLVQEAFGVNDHIEDVGARFASAGWFTVAPHVFHRTGDPQLGYDDLPAVMPHIQALTADGLLADIDDALAAIAAAGIEPARTGVVGFCMGGTVALITGVEREVGAAVTFYGGGVAEGRFGFPPLVEMAPRLRCPWLGLFGDLDKGIPVEQVEALREAAATSGQDTDVVRYADATHGFHCDRRDSYHEASAKDAWDRTLRWFDTHLT